VLAITLEGDANRAPDPDPSACSQAIVDVDGAT
jgi:hypothetical protein